MTQPREPIFNVPPVVLATLAALALVHVIREFVLSPDTDRYVLAMFAFIPGRFAHNILADPIWPGGWLADVWTFVTYAFIHADWVHLGVNSIWLLAFGTPLARRFGPARFLAFFAVTAAAGAFAHLVAYADVAAPMIGASAAISGMMAAAMRFAFQRGGPIFARGRDEAANRVPALSLAATLSNPRILIFLAVWFGINLIFGLGGVSISGEDQPIAWQAHVGGFVAGLLLFGLFDPVSAGEAGPNIPIEQDSPPGPGA